MSTNRRASRQKERTVTKKKERRFTLSLSSLKGNDPTDFKLNMMLALLVGTMVLSSVLVVNALPNSPFAGGWEIQLSMSKMILDGDNKDKTVITTNLHTASYDTDGDFLTAYAANPSPDEVYPPGFDDPDILVKVGYPHYLEQISTGWVESDDAVLIDHYPRDYNSTNDDGSITMVHVDYMEFAVGMSVQIQTVAEKYEKPVFIPFIQEGYADAGWYYEDNQVNVKVRSTLALSPWTPVGTYDGWTMAGGWAGLMSVSVYKVEYGMNEPGATENQGHIIQGLMSVGQAANMWIADTSTTVSPSDLGDYTGDSDPTAIPGIPTAIEFETYASLAAGAEYTTNLAGHWDSCSVRNVFVTYHLKASYISTLVYTLAVGSEGEIEPPPENNTNYPPVITPLTDFWESLELAFPGFQNILILVVVAIGGIAFIILMIKFGRRGSSRPQYIQPVYSPPQYQPQPSG